jgi:hypothetical protein
MAIIHIYILTIYLKSDFTHLFWALKNAGVTNIIFCELKGLPPISFQYFTNEKRPGKPRQN